MWLDNLFLKNTLSALTKDEPMRDISDIFQTAFYNTFTVQTFLSKSPKTNSYANQVKNKHYCSRISRIHYQFYQGNIHK